MDAAPKTTESSKEKYLRFERLAEIFTYIAIVGGAGFSFLPYQFYFDKISLRISIFVIAIFAVFWFRLLPKKYSGGTKNFVYALLSIAFIAIAVHFTRGPLSVVVFLFFVTGITTAASMTLGQTITVVALSLAAIGFEAFLGTKDPSLGAKSLSMGLLHAWGLLLTTSYGWMVFQEEKEAKIDEEKAKMVKVEAIDQVKNEFVFIISNKLREPISILQHSLKDVVKDTKDLSSEQVDILKKTDENSDRLASLVDDLSDLSKIESGSLNLEMKEVDIGQIIGATMSDFTFPAHEKNIKLVYEPAKKPAIVRADSGRLHEVIANLVDNAIKYSFEGKEVHVSLKEEKDIATVQISDQGFGIPDQARKHLFEKFYRVDRQDRVEPKGTGLGLFITKQLVERQEGKIWFESEVDKGTTFSVSLNKAQAKQK